MLPCCQLYCECRDRVGSVQLRVILPKLDSHILTCLKVEHRENPRLNPLDEQNTITGEWHGCHSKKTLKQQKRLLWQGNKSTQLLVEIQNTYYPTELLDLKRMPGLKKLKYLLYLLNYNILPKLKVYLRFDFNCQWSTKLNWFKKGLLTDGNNMLLSSLLWIISLSNCSFSYNGVY